MSHPLSRASRALHRLPTAVLEGVWRFGGALLCLLAIAGAGRAEAGATPRLELQMTPQASFDSATFGANGEKGIGFTFALLNASELDDLTAQGPFTLRVELPPGVHYAGKNGGSWSCTGAAQTVECTHAADLTYWMWGSSGLGIWIDTDADLPVPGNGLIRATIESAEAPLPNPVVCEDVPVYNVATSDTGCVARSLPHRRSELHIVHSSWHHNTPVFTAGGTGQVGVGFRSIGYGQNNGPVTFDLLLPPGLTRSSVGDSPPFTCTDGPTTPQGTLLSCTTAYLYDGQQENTAWLYVNVNVAEDVAVPGPLPVYATIHNAQQPARVLSTCDDVPMPVGCGYYNGITTAVAPQPLLEIVDVTHQPEAFTTRREGRLFVTFANIGDGTAGATTLQAALPPAVRFERATGFSPDGSCSASGDPVTGQTVTCQYAQGLPPIVTGYSGSVMLHVTIGARAATTLPFVFALGDTQRPGPTLAECSADPDQVGCATHAVPVLPWIFCDGFENLTHECGEPQRFD